MLEENNIMALEITNMVKETKNNLTKEIEKSTFLWKKYF